MSVRTARLGATAPARCSASCCCKKLPVFWRVMPHRRRAVQCLDQLPSFPNVYPCVPTERRAKRETWTDGVLSFTNTRPN